MKKVNAEFFGEKVTNAGYGKLASIFDSKDNKLSAFANHAAFEYIVNGNREFLDALFTCDRLLLKSGQLNAEGKRVALYVQTFSPITVQWDKSAAKLTIAKAKDKKVKHCFYTGEKLDGKKVAVTASEKPQWPMTIAQLVAQRDNAEKAAPAKTAATPKALAGRVEKLVEALGTVDARKASGDELRALQAALHDAYNAASDLIATNSSHETATFEPVQQAFNDMANSVSGKAETRADTDRAKHAETA